MYVYMYVCNVYTYVCIRFLPTELSNYKKVAGTIGHYIILHGNVLPGAVSTCNMSPPTVYNKPTPGRPFLSCVIPNESRLLGSQHPSVA